ncbi:FadR/GntR family transcriptional regulator [Paenarthrobacter sp. NCHU4564]|uniref:FadR/GntR family transcriptional regulator n=1 Tax=Paenarthrobacter sp. NCHU4564 TaxID=3451353 RepID=UPI003F982931
MLDFSKTLRTMLLDGLAAGTLGPGSKVPTERELVKQLSTSRNSIRRALAQLENEGLLIRHVGRGTFLSEAVATASASPSDTSPATIMQARLVIEPPLASVAAMTATLSDLELIRGHLIEGASADGFEAFESKDAELHRAIAAASRNGVMVRMFDVMNAARALPVWGDRKRQTSTPERRRLYHQDHVVIVEALLGRDPEGAEAAMRNHLRRVAENLVGGP